MEGFLNKLPYRARVLDLGSAEGSFTTQRKDLVVVRLDLEPRAGLGSNFVAADAAALPLPSQSFELVIANHSLEHFSNLEAALQEIGRVLKPGGGLFVSVPD